MAEAVKVVVRCRPMSTKEKERGCGKIVKVDGELLQIALLKPEGKGAGDDPKAFTFDAVYDDDSKQRDVYEETAFGLVTSVMDGYNGTIFAYGQTGCGKTFTMEGLREPREMRGIIPCSFDQIFETIAANPQADKKFLVRASYLEIYNEEVRDLLAADPNSKLDVREDKDKGFFVHGLTQKVVAGVDQMNQLMTAGNANRSVGETAMNATSSRSHSLFTVCIETSEPSPNGGDDRIKAGKLNLVDLAGSERQSKTGAQGGRLKEANNINLSLSALGNVIESLVKGKGHIPYRNSKLTKLLADSLGGNTKTVMIAALSPADYNYDETLSTLRYANRAKNIKNKPKVNEDPKDALLRQYQDEIKMLKKVLEDARNGIPIPTNVSFDTLISGPGGASSASVAVESKKPKALLAPVISAAPAKAAAAAATTTTTTATPTAASGAVSIASATPTAASTTVAAKQQAAAPPAGTPATVAEESGELGIEDLDALPKTAATVASLPHQVSSPTDELLPPSLATSASSSALSGVVVAGVAAAGAGSQQLSAAHQQQVDDLLRQREDVARTMHNETSRLEKEKSEHEAKAAELERQIQEEKAQREELKREREALSNQLAAVSEASKAELARREAEATEYQQRLEAARTAHEQRARDLAADVDRRVEEEQAKQIALANQIKHIEERSANEQEALKVKLHDMELQLLEGGKKANDATAAAEQKAREAKDRLKIERKKKAAAREEQKRIEEEKLMLEEKYKTVEDEVAAKTQKLRRLQKKYKAQLEETREMQDEWENEKEGYLNNIREIYRELRLHKMICATFLAQSDIDKIIQASRFDEDKDSWTLPTIELPTVFPKVNGSHSDADPSFGPRGRLEHGDLRYARPGVHSASSNGVGGGRNGSAAANRMRSGSRLDGDYNNTGGADSGWRHSVVRDVSSDQLYAASQVLNGRSSTPPTAKTIIATPARLNPMDEHSSLVAPQAAIRSTSSSVRRPSQLVADLEPAVHGADLSHHLGNDTLPSGAPLPRGRGHFEGGHVTSTMGDDRTRMMDELPRGRGHFEPSSIAEEESSSLPDSLTAARRVRPSFQPAAGVDTSLPTSSSSSSIASMNVRGRGAFEPDMSILRSNSPVSASLPADHPMNKPRVPFKPSVPIAAAPPPLPDSMNMPRPKRPVFQPALTATSPAADGEHKTGIDISSLPPAKSFNPAPLADGRQAGQSRADMEAQMASLPAAKSFQPAVHMAVRQSDSHDPLDINVASRPAFRPSVPTTSSPLGGGGGNDGDASPRRPNIPSVPRTRPAFTPATSSIPLSSSPGGSGMSTSLSSDDPLSFAPKSRPRFEPAGATPAFGMSHNNDNDPLRNAPIPTKPTFRPAFGVRA